MISRPRTPAAPRWPRLRFAFLALLAGACSSVTSGTERGTDGGRGGSSVDASDDAREGGGLLGGGGDRGSGGGTAGSPASGGAGNGGAGGTSGAGGRATATGGTGGSNVATGGSGAVAGMPNDCDASAGNCGTPDPCAGDAGRALCAPWSAQFGSPAIDWAWAAASDADGNVYITGHTEGAFDDKTHLGRGDVFLIKYAPDGAKLWSRQLGTAENDEGVGITVDAAGSVYLTGFTAGSLDGKDHAGLADMFLVKYSAVGDKAWTAVFGSDRSDIGQDVTTDGSGNVYMAGRSDGSMGTEPNTGSADDLVLVKVTALGDREWIRQLGTAYLDRAYGVKTDDHGDIYVAGSTSASLAGDPHAGGSDLALVKYDGGGDLLWAEQIGSSLDDEARGLALDDGGNIFVVGRTLGSVDGHPNLGDYDVVVVKYSSSGVRLRSTQLGTAEKDYAWGTAIDANGGLYIAGSTAGTLPDQTNEGGEDMLVIKLDGDLELMWARQTGSGLDDRAHDVSVGPAGVYVTGMTDATIDGHESVGEKDAVVIRYDARGNRL